MKSRAQYYDGPAELTLGWKCHHQVLWGKQHKFHFTSLMSKYVPLCEFLEIVIHVRLSRYMESKLGLTCYSYTVSKWIHMYLTFSFISLLICLLFRMYLVSKVYVFNMIRMYLKYAHSLTHLCFISIDSLLTPLSLDFFHMILYFVMYLIARNICIGAFDLKPEMKSLINKTICKL